MPEFRVSEVRCVQYELAIDMRASRQRVWKGITDQISAWWLPDFHMLGEDSIVTLEPRAGGRLFEQNGASELLWYSVLAITPQDSLSLVGHCTAEFGGPSTSMLTMRLTGEESSTRLTVFDSLYGHVSDSHAESLRSGWMQLFSNGLKTWAEQH